MTDLPVGAQAGGDRRGRPQLAGLTWPRPGEGGGAGPGVGLHLSYRERSKGEWFLHKDTLNEIICK